MSWLWRRLHACLQGELANLRLLLVGPHAAEMSDTTLGTQVASQTLRGLNVMDHHRFLLDSIMATAISGWFVQD